MRDIKNSSASGSGCPWAVSGAGSLWAASAVLAASLLTGQMALAQALTYGPILGRGHTADQTLVRWGTGGTADATSVAYRLKGAAMWQLQGGSAARDHEVILTGLAAGQTYEYEVRSLGMASGAEFTTCPLPGRPMDFVFYGDSRTGFGTVAGEHAKVLAQVASKSPEMIFESGDIVPNGTYAQYLSEFFPAAKDLIKSTPFMAAPGNHDAISNLVMNFGQVFPSPRPAGAAWQSYYSFTCGNALFLSLDSNSVTDATQLKFITDQLQAGRDDATIAHVFVWLHHAPYSVGTHGDNTQVQSKWVPILNRPENKVTAVFSGHDHLYARMNDSSGVFYIVSGGAGANLYDDKGTSKAVKVTSKSTFNFVTIHLAGQTMGAVAYDDTGTEIDRFAVTKSGMLPDGGATDGGTTDGGATDGGATDGGATDGGATDGGATDSGAPGSPDSGADSADAASQLSDLAMPPTPGGGCVIAAAGGPPQRSPLGLGTLLLLCGTLLSRRRGQRRRAAA